MPYKDPIKEKEQVAYKKWGYYNISDIGILAGRDRGENRYSISVLVTNGYKFKNGIALGVVTGVEAMEIALAPILAELRMDISDNKTTPFIAVRAGYCFPLENDLNELGEPVYQGGYSVGSVVGVRNYFANKTALVFSIGFRRTQFKSEQIFWWWEESPREQIDILNRVEVRLGFMFN